MTIRLTPGEKIFKLTNTIILIVLSLLFLYPFWYILILSFNEGMDATTGGIYWWPRVLTLGNYFVVFTDSTILNAFFISALRTVLGTAGSILITSMVAFGLSRKELPGRNLFVTVFFITMLFSGGLIPYYLQLMNLKLINKFWVYVLPGLFSVWNMIVMKTSFKSNIPESIIESVRIDGAGYCRIYFSIILPLSLPLLAALGLFTAVGQWNDWFSGAFFVSDIKLQPLQTYLYRVMSTVEATNMINVTQVSSLMQTKLYNPNAITTTSVRMATIMVSTAPILCVYPFLQKYFVKGVMIGSIKE
jgi:putative aldouronate transport system permease protein